MHHHIQTENEHNNYTYNMYTEEDRREKVHTEEHACKKNIYKERQKMFILHKCTHFIVE